MTEPIQPDRPAARVEIIRVGPWIQVGTPAGFERTRVFLPISGLPPELAGLRLLHLTDQHLRSDWCDAFDEMIAMTVADPPDLILCTGDFVEAKYDHRAAIPTLRRLMTGLAARIGIYGILGNHDGDLLGPTLADMGVRLINGRCVELVDATAGHDVSLELIGLPGVWLSDLRPGFVDAIPPRRPGVPRIVMAHFPDMFPKIAGLDADIMLAGHTHGGQVCLPGGRPIITHDSLPRRMCKGVHRIENGNQTTWLVVSKGMGFGKYKLRLFCPAELTEIVLIPFPEMHF